MKKKLLFIFIFSSSFLIAQKDKTDKNAGSNFHWISEQWVIAPCGGQFHPDLNAFNDEMTKEGAKSVFFLGLRGYGLTVAQPINLSQHGGEFDGSFAFNYLTNYKVSIGNKTKPDSLTYEMRGWDFMTSCFGKDVIPGKTVALVLAPGIDWGSLRMVRTLNGLGTLYRNFYIAPLARAELRFVFGPVALGARAIYRYDLTNEDWKLKKGPTYALPGTKNTGTSIEFFVGWGHVRFQ